MSDHPVIPGAIPVAVPARVARLLRTAPDGELTVLHRGPLAVYVEVSGRAIGVLARGAIELPNAVRSTISAFAPQSPARAYLERGILHVDGRPLSMVRPVEVHIPRFRAWGLSCSTASSVTLAATPPAAVTEFVVSRLSSSTRQLSAASVPALIGAGDGLTPLGDDVLAGWLATHRALGTVAPEVDAVVAAITAHAHRTTLLSATLLDCADHGEAIPQLGRWLHALSTPAESSAGHDLLAVGGSSGAGLMYGALLALDLDHLTRREAAA